MNTYKLATRTNAKNYQILRCRDRNKNVIMEHVLIAEKAIGKPLPKGARIHHIDENPNNNENSNLLVCDRTYHKLIHVRLEAKKACGNPDWRKCKYCKEYDDLENLVTYTHGVKKTYLHRECNRVHDRKKYWERKTA